MTIYLGSSIVPTKGPAMKPGKIPERTWTKDEAEAETFAGSRIHQDGDHWHAEVWDPVYAVWDQITCRHYEDARKWLRKARKLQVKALLEASERRVKWLEGKKKT